MDIVVVGMLFLLLLLLILYVHVKLFGFTIYSFYVVGCILFVWGGFLSVKMDDHLVYFMNNAASQVDNIVPNAVVFSLILVAFSFFPHRRRLVSLGEKDYACKLREYSFVILCVQLIVSAVSVVVLFTADVAKAPIFYVLSASHAELGYMRRAFYESFLFPHLRFLVLYVMVPLLLFIRGMGGKVYVMLLYPSLFMGVCSLAKTFSIVSLTFYFVGCFIRRGISAKLVLYSAVSILFAFFLLVKLRYWNDGRTVLDIVSVFFVRVFQVPVALCSVYLSNLDFGMGLRSSRYYTYVFGGEVVDISSYIGSIIMGSQGGVIPQSPAGIIGSVAPNIPESFYCLFFAGVSLFVVLVSAITSLVKSDIIRVLLVILLGFESWFFFLTDPLVTLNTYGFMWTAFLAFAILIIESMLDGSHVFRMGREERYDEF